MNGPSHSIPKLAEAYRAIESDLPAVLVDAHARAMIAEMTTSIPSVMATFGFECRLLASDSTVDLGLAVMPTHGGVDVLAGLEANGSGSDSLTRDSRWKRIREFARAWSRDSASLRTWIPFLFMEFDAVSMPDGIPVPSIFVALDAPLAPQAQDDSEMGSGPIAAVREAAAMLSGESLAPDVDAQVVRAFEMLPEAAWVMHMAVLLGRGSSGVRLSVAIPGRELPDYLRALGSDTAAEMIVELRKCLGHRLDWTQVDFDLNPALQPRLGIGLKPRSDDEWQGLLETIEAEGWCDAEKRRALLHWPGRRRVQIENVRYTLVREISHIKLVCQDGQTTTAKAYIGVTPVPEEQTERGAGFVV